MALVSSPVGPCRFCKRVGDICAWWCPHAAWHALKLYWYELSLSLLVGFFAYMITDVLLTSSTARADITPGGGGGSSSASVPGSDTQCIFNDGGAFGADAGCVYNKTTDTATIGTVIGSTAIRGPAGSGAAPGLQLLSATFGFYNSVNAIVVRAAGSDVAKFDGGNYGLSQYADVVTAHTSSFTTSQPDSAHIHTNTGASGAITATLMNNADGGLFWRFAVTAAQTYNVAPSAGETMKDGSASCANLACATIGCWLTMKTVVGGSGGSFFVSEKSGTWTCT